MTVYVDSDGVVANFDTAATEVLGMPPREYEDRYGSDAFWDKLCSVPRFYYSLQLYPGAVEFIEEITELTGERPWILSGSPSYMPRGHFDKQEFFKKHLGPEQPVITCQSKHKSNFCRPGDVIIDDYEKHMQAWLDKGGAWILHTSFENSLRALRSFV